MKVILVLTLVAAATALSVYKKESHSSPSYSGSDYKESYGPANYKFDWDVKDDQHYVDMGHQEARNGDNTKGSYHVLLPDGRRQTVNYYVDGYSGYIADVQHSGEYKTHSPSYGKPGY